ncbi:hypothetical protein HHK36_019881 [Tetracentron sinense]|uniref:DC1 domain-containing protein n=1 Tax=Tetracentron sinense TaxID=13715 RepID=A0A835DAG0_TETSI|nr:hypothetical protein HHK36_019881 [Tetracentron sinense]
MGRLIINEETPSFSHFSHSHPLELVILGDSGKVTCFGCNNDIASGREYYTCKACSYNLHKVCYDMPRKISHSAHKIHDLILSVATDFDCKACGHHGTGFSYKCNPCLYDCHVLCSVMPLEFQHQSHQHILNLEFSSPYGGAGFQCDICSKPGSNHWVYRCDECQYDVHLRCATTNQAQPPPQSPLAPAMEAPTMSATNINNMGPSMGAPQFNPDANQANTGPNYVVMPPNYVVMPNQANTGPNYVVMPNQANTRPNYVVMPNGNNFNQAGSYGYNQGAYVHPNGMMMGAPQANQGFGYANQPGPGFPRGGIGNGLAGVAAVGVATGVAEGMGQEIFRSATGGLGDTSGSSNNSSESSDSDIVHSLIGG